MITYAKVKSHDPEIYNKDRKFFRNDKTQLVLKQHE